MQLLSRIRHWLRALLARRRVEGEMQREMGFHLEMETERLVREGVPREEAGRRARATFGGVERFKEAVRDQRGLQFVDAFATELRVALRGLRRRPAFAVVVVLTIAIGAGATTAVYSWADWALFRPVPGVRDPQQVVSIGFQTKPDERGAYSPTGISYPNYRDLKQTVHAFEGLAGYAEETTQLAGTGFNPIELEGHLVLGDYFGVLGVVPRLGRVFTAAELRSDATDRVMVISDSVWHLAFGASRAVLGRRVKVNGVEFTIVGVAPPGFRGTARAGRIDLWFPAAAFGPLRHASFDLASRRTNAFMQLIGRRRPGVSPQMAQDDLNRRLALLIAAYPGINDVYKDCRAVVNADLGMDSMRRARMLETVRLMLTTVALLLLISCANVANLLLLRASQRREALAVRRALGASARRVVGQHMLEGVLLSLLGGGVGLALAVGLARLFSSRSLFGAPTYSHFVLDWRVLAVAIGLGIGTGILFGLAPAVAAVRSDPMRHLKEGLGRQSARRAPVRSALTVVQVGAATALVVGAILLGRTLYAIANVNLGFDATNVSTFWIDTRPQGFSPPRMGALRQTLLARASAIPGASAAIASSLPGMGAYLNVGVRTLDDTAKRASATATYFTVSPGFFSALRIPFVHGSAFAPAAFDDTTSVDAVISLSLARHLFGARNPVGRQFRMRSFGGPAVRTVVGVTGDVHTEGPIAAPGYAVYVPAGGGAFGAFLNSSFELVVRSAEPPDRIRRDVREMLLAAAPDVPLPAGRPFRSLVEETVSGPHLFARLIGVLALLAALLAAIGLYAVIAFAVAERKREIGIRMALGAHGRAVVGLVARQSSWLVGAGLVVGLGGAVALARLLAASLFGVGPLDPLSYVGAAVAWAILALIATYIPARAATRVDPTIAMRAE